MQASRKKVYMLYGIQPDRSVTGGSWYTDQDFDSQFVDTLVMMCHRFLEQKVFSTFFTLMHYPLFLFMITCIFINVMLASSSGCKGSNAPSVRSPVVDKDRM